MDVSKSTGTVLLPLVATVVMVDAGVSPCLSVDFHRHRS